MVTSSKEEGKHAFKCELLQHEICLPLRMQKLMDKQSRLDHVIKPVFSSWVLTACLKVAAQLLECLVADGEDGHEKGS